MNAFSTLVLDRPWNVAYDIRNYNFAAPPVRELLVEGNRPAFLQTVDMDRYVRMGLKPSLNKTGDILDHVEINTRNEEFQPARIPAKALKHFISTMPAADIPAFVAAKGATPVPEECLDGLTFDGKAVAEGSTLTFFALTVISGLLWKGIC
eukprot:CAMPEP_0172323760 /NCGR_PEP_ID=MMETSP1058-20130122/49496_1 /TAXON_ID=83371 /ORGANISM="Detonula confervacea, Strain CCMP 353" /LENGTH=150 /DNA_ID=CAMNT_0013039845 /DNA_START=401 /DNA_END=853 /DNA_ORIENTATION=-